MSDLAHDLIHIAVGHLLPKPKKYAWVSAVESGPYHIETNDSAANGGQGFKAICGAAGDFNCHLQAGQIFPSQKCKTCVESSTGNILDVAQGGTNDRNDCIGVLPCSAEVEKESQANAGSTRRSLSPNTEEICSDHAQTARQDDSGVCVRQLRKNRQIDVADRATGNAPVTDGLQVGDEGVGGGTEGRAIALGVSKPVRAHSVRASSENQASPADSQTFTPLYLLASEIVDIVELAEQYRAEENAAAEEGALIEASGYPDPGSNRSFA